MWHPWSLVAGGEAEGIASRVKNVARPERNYLFMFP